MRLVGRSRESLAPLVAAAAGLGNVLLALFFLPYSPGFDDRGLYSSIYAYQHYGRLFYPVYDLPLMYIHPPTKYWLVGVLVSSGVALRVATAGLLVVSYLVAVAGAFACRFTCFQRLAVLFAISATVTLCPFISYNPENLAHGEVIGKLRPDDLVLVFWLGGLLWLEASRGNGWRSSYSFIGGLCIGLASIMHYFGIPAVAVIAVYGGAALFEGGPLRGRRLVPVVLGLVVVLVPFVLAVRPYLTQISAMILGQAGETSPRGVVDVWRRHLADFWFLLQWMKRHTSNVWAAAALMAAPVWMGVPPLVIGGIVLLVFRSSRVLGLAALSVPVAVLFAAHKSIGYELPEVALFLLACGWALSALLDRSADERLRLAAAGFFVLAVATSSPLVWHPSELRFMDQTHSPELLRAMGRAVIGPGATVVGSILPGVMAGRDVYIGGEDTFVLAAGLDECGIDFVAEREFHLAAARLHRMYRGGRVRLAGFVLTPETPSASVVYFTARTTSAPLKGFITRNGEIQRFSQTGTGWKFKMLDCRASREELPWVSPRPPVRIAGYIPRTDHCANRVLSAKGLDGRFASIFLRGAYPNGEIAERAMVPLLIDDAADAQSSEAMRQECGCETVQSTFGGLTEVPAHWLLAGLRETDRVIRFYATAADLMRGRSMATRFAAGREE